MSQCDLTWVLTTGEAGMRSQALGLAEAVGLPIEEKRIAVRRAWSWLPGGLLPMPRAVLDRSGDPLLPPWPRLVIGCGRRSIDATLMVKRLSGGATLAAYVQNPEWGRQRFDLVAAMPHDNVSGGNVVTISTALHPVIPARLAEAGGVWRERLRSGRGPLVGVLIGGNNGSYRLTSRVTDRLIEILRSAHAGRGARVAITPSRRTSNATKQQLGSALGGQDWAWLWDEHGENPYFGILALADRLVVTSESISMISEALATGRPVHVLPLEGRGKRHEAFLQRAAGEGLISPVVAGDLEWAFAGPGPVQSVAEPASRLRQMLGL